MFLKKTALIFVSAIIIPSIFNFALADRMAGSNFNKGIISQIGQCKDLAKHHAMAIEISVNNQYVVYVISGNITPYTLLKDQDGSTVDCNALQKGMTVTVGHAEGDDTGEFANGLTIIDSITTNSSNKKSPKAH